MSSRRQQGRRTADWGISDRAREQCRTLGLSHEEVMSYVRQAAPFTGEGFNKRYETFLFRVERRVVEDIGLLEDHDGTPAPPTQDLSAELLKRAFEFLEQLLESRVANKLPNQMLDGAETLVDDIEQHLK